MATPPLQSAMTGEKKKHGGARKNSGVKPHKLVADDQRDLHAKKAVPTNKGALKCIAAMQNRQNHAAAARRQAEARLEAEWKRQRQVATRIENIAKKKRNQEQADREALNLLQPIQ